MTLLGFAWWLWVLGALVALILAASGAVDAVLAFLIGPDRYERWMAGAGRYTQRFRAWASRQERAIEDRVVAFGKALKELLGR